MCIQTYVKEPHYPDYSKKVYVEPHSKITSIFSSAIEEIGSQAKLGSKYGYTQSAVHCWLHKKAWIPLKIFFEICRSLHVDPFKILNGKKLHGKVGGGEITFQKYLLKELSYEDAFLRSDGHIYHKAGAPLVFYQYDKKLLQKIKRDLLKITKLDSKSVKIYKPKNRQEDRLIVYSTPLKFIFVNLLKNPVGKKPHNIPLPFIWNQYSRTSRFKWLAGIIDGEGNFDYSSRSPALKITMKSELVNHIKLSFENFGYNFNFIRDKRKGFVTIKLGKHLQFAKFAFEILPYMRKTQKIKDMLNVLSTPHYLEALHIPSCKDLFQMAWEKYITQKEVRLLIKQKLGKNVSKAALQHWIHDRRNPPLNIVLLLCKLLNISPLKILGNPLSLLLYTHGYVSFHKIKRIYRKGGDLMELFEAIKGRRSVRAFLDSPVEKEKIGKLLDAARWAPSAGNK